MQIIVIKIKIYILKNIFILINNMDIDGLIVVTVTNFHQHVFEYIKTNNRSVSNVDDIMNTYTDMLREGYCFTVDREVMSNFLIDILYVISPDDDNLQLVRNTFVDDDDDNDDNNDNDDN